MKYRKFLATGLAAAVLLGGASVAFAFGSNDYSLFDSAHYVSPGNASARAVQLVSNATSTDGGIDYTVGSGVTLTDITNLSTDYKFDAGSCGGGSPRFQVNVQTPSNGVKNLFVYMGPPPNYTNCPQNVWTNTGNLVTPASLVDATQLGGTFYEPYSAVVAAYGSYPVVGIQLVADAGWAFPSTGQTVDVDNTTINSTLYTYEVPVAATAAQCKNGGWQNLADNNGHSFKNQGDCVSFVATGGKNQGNGQ